MPLSCLACAPVYLLAKFTITMETTNPTEMGSNASFWGPAETSGLVGWFDLVSCTQYGITLHSASSPLRPKRRDGPQLTQASSAESEPREPQQVRWPFFQDKCVLEEGMLSYLFAEGNPVV